MKLRRYLLFCFNSHEQTGGWGDYIGSYHTMEGAISAWQDLKYPLECYHVVDSDSGEIVDLGFRQEEDES